MKLLEEIDGARKSGRTLLAQLIDPDKVLGFDHLADIAKCAEESGVDIFFFGGSLVTQKSEFDIIKALKDISNIPVALFPSSPSQIDESADALLFLSLISGRNPSFLIDHHVLAAPLLRNSSLEIIPTGYLLVSCGSMTTAEYVSNTLPIPYNKPEIAATTAFAGQLLGMKMIYLDGGSGADKSVDTEMVKQVKSWIDVPLIVGGGIKTAQQAAELAKAGADVIVIGTSAEKNPDFLRELKAKMK